MSSTSWDVHPFSSGSSSCWRLVPGWKSDAIYAILMELFSSE